MDLWGSSDDKTHTIVSIWWGIAAWPADSFVENNGFTGKAVITFAASSSFGMGEWTGIVIIENKIFRNAGRIFGILLVFSDTKIEWEEL